MKTLKNDTRYIIKRVLIGVLIAIVLFNARRCGVYADTISSYKNFNLTNNNLNATWIVNTSSSFNCSYGQKYTFEYETTQYNVCINNKDAQYTPSMMINVFEYNDNLYISYLSMSNNSFNNMVKFDYILSYASDNVTGRVDYLVTYDTNSTVGANSFNLAPNYQPNGNYNNKFINLTTYPTRTDLTATDLITNNLYEDLSLVYTNTNKPIYINNVEIVPPSTFPPSGYSELSLKDYQGVVFVPKNYNDIQCSVVGDLCNTTFDYYYQEEIKEAYFPLDNRFNIRFNSDFLNSPNEHSELKSTYFPISQVSVNETFYYAFMIYNYTNDGSPLDPETYYAYGDAKVWYDSTLWNYYLVDDFNTWSANVCYMLDGNEVCTTISGLPTLKDAIEQAQLEDNILGTHVGDLNLFSSIIRFPLGFVQSLSSESCTAIQLPPLPFIGGNISLPCMSLIYQQVLGIYQPVISGFINFIIIYYLIVALIKFYNKTFDPSHTEIEVIDL